MPRAAAILLAAGLLALVLAHQGWWTVSAEGSVLGLTGVESSAGLARALPLVALGGLLATLTLGPVGRRVMGVLVGAAFAGVVALGLAHPAPADADVLDRLRSVSLADSWDLAPGWTPWAYAASGVLGLVGSALLVVAPVTNPSRSVRDRPAQVADPADSWKAMDAGLDPTVPLHDDTQEDA